jgi:hypothetical protein
MTTQAAGVLADPVGVIVDLVAGVELALDRTAITAVVTRVAGGRARQRRLARCLAGRPSVLADGRSPASEAAGELLIALRRAGAVGIALPACGRRPARCASCGQDRATATVDRQGRPRCRQRPDDDDRDPVAILTGVITDLEPSLPAGRIAAAAWRAQPGPAKLRRLAWAVEDAPGLLTGDGAHAPMPAVLRLIDELCDAGAQAIIRPGCPRCHRVIRLAQRIGGQWLCRNCVARSRAQPCSRCGAVREAAARDEHGRPRCSNCLVNDPATQEACVTCGPAPPGQQPDRGRAVVRYLPAPAGLDLPHLRPTGPVPGLQGDRQAPLPGLHQALGQLRWLRPGPPGPRRLP